MSNTKNLLCVHCNVPIELHGTECGWENAKAIVNEKYIVTDIRHPGFGKHLNRWKGSFYDSGSADGYDISYSIGYTAGYDQAIKDSIL